ncbi:DUF418 domain-containing protein [Paenibacillus caseinilyticus]|uniref:Membrane protein n=1 Tax=Paenibacillus mucilaginosus K02 TaxID=997761 RepID=I0BBU6_9BACL|nr:DUF418 domain-containing protein [Paenibacillus mucilaginosus]AFH59843.1 membrane protein [Paenibacillus mucilaginosus K02]
MVKDEARGAAERLTGLDLARSLAVFGMILVNYKIAMGAEAGGPPWLAAAAGLLEGRSSAVFVMLAGIGLSLMTRRARQGEAGELRRSRTVIRKRALYLLLLGIGLLLAGWSADILHYYALYLFLGSFLIRAPSGALLVWTAGLLVCAQGQLLLLDYRTGWDPAFHQYLDFWTPEGFLRNLWFNGYHPMLPWFAFFVFGMWLGRLSLRDEAVRRRGLLVSLGVGFLSEATAFAARSASIPYLDEEGAAYLFGTKPMPPGLFYMLSAGGTAAAVILLCLYAADRLQESALAARLIPAGQMALTHYVLHVIAGLGLLELLGALENGSLPFALLYGTGYYAAALLLSGRWLNRFGRGPFESLMRRL